MGATVADWKIRESETVSEVAATNGGFFAQDDLPSGVLGRVFRVGLPDELDPGYEEWKKLFGKLEDSESRGAAGCYLFMEDVPDADDEVHFCAPSAFGDYQEDIEAALETEFYGIAVLATAIEAGVSTQAVVTIKEETRPGFHLHAGTLRCYISDGTNYEFFDVDTIDVDGTEVTLTRTSGTFENSYAVETPTCVAACMSVASPEAAAGIVLASQHDIVVTSAAGTFAEDELTVNNTGARQDVFTLTFDADGVTFSVEGANYGALPDGTINDDYTAIDANGKILFEIGVAAWGGTFAENDTVEIPTEPAAFGAWFRHTVPASCAGASNVTTRIRIAFAAI